MIIADENIDARIISVLRAHDIEIYSIAEKTAGISDTEVIALVKRENAILLTEDKDFGEWVFAHGIKGLSVLFLRYEVKDFNQIALIILEVLDRKLVQTNSYITITKEKVRIRKL